MAVEIKLPNVGDGIESGDVLSVLVKEGDQVTKDQGIVELETGKATIEIPSTHAGKVVKVHVSKGQTVPIGGALISVEAAEKAVAKPAPKADAPKAEAEPQPAAEAKAEAKPAKAEAKASKAEAKPEPAQPAAKAAKAPAEPAKAPKPAPAAVKTAEPEEEQDSEETAEDRAGGDVIPASPAVRRFAREVGVDLTKVSGTGEGGRITREDVLAVVRRASQAAVRGGSSTPTPPGDVITDNWGVIRVEKMPKIRQTIAAKMHESWSTVPRVTNFDDADVTELERFRQASKDDYAARGIRLTSLPFLIKAVAMALRQHPVVNASIDLDNGQIIYKDYVNVGIAVDSERGLVVPSLRNADKLSIPEIALGIATLADKIRNGQFGLDDLKGSTFTVSNLGAIGGTYSTPIVNTPEVAILLVGRSRKLPVVIDDEVTVRLMMPLSLSYDHRLVDGAAAARFLNDVMSYLKAPSRLLLAI